MSDIHAFVWTPRKIAKPMMSEKTHRIEEYQNISKSDMSMCVSMYQRNWEVPSLEM